MHVRATVIASWALGLLVAQSTAGCSIELVRTSIEPPAVEARPVDGGLDAAAMCRLDGDPQDDGNNLIKTLVAALNQAGTFQGDVLEPACEARLRVTRVSEPDIRTGLRQALGAMGVLTGGALVPLWFVWTDREPDLVARYALEVGPILTAVKEELDGRAR